MTGKSELTSSLRDRLAGALSVDPGFLTSAAATPTSHTYSFAAAAHPNVDNGPGALAPSIAAYLTEPAHLATTLRTLPSGDSGRRLKRALLNALEDLSVESALSLPPDFSEIRRGVLSGEL
jgi:hypothetical protein